ncbi:hypothetical protein H6F74_01225 [Trichocoleus sp. FACHB-90]|uniref:hypothetical protein n=1 Tax=Cyanophyceae TaxID=3028117 RepID=UPI001685A217|nr:hypothetical protein [Trichocoleus sp. FACHB-90]MBD1835479.1 hypothetical protein [Cyanobacteria bacterium FACHB-472]MBD1924910.1 hypothetical protein [Trichocoleus sp. FACHB-90]
MPSGHASHKGASAKTNTNADGLINAAADESTPAPQGVINEASDSTRLDEAPENAAATERPHEEE